MHKTQTRTQVTYAHAHRNMQSKTSRWSTGANKRTRRLSASSAASRSRRSQSAARAKAAAPSAPILAARRVLHLFGCGCFATIIRVAISRKKKKKGSSLPGRVVSCTTRAPSTKVMRRLVLSAALCVLVLPTSAFLCGPRSFAALQSHRHTAAAATTPALRQASTGSFAAAGTPHLNALRNPLKDALPNRIKRGRSAVGHCR